MTGNIYISGQIGTFDGVTGVSLIDVIAQVKKQPKATAFNVHINILVAFNNLPSGLVKTNESSLFGNSGEAIREMKRTYWENTTKERNLLTSVINQLFTRSQDFSSLSVEPLKLIEDATIDNTQ